MNCEEVQILLLQSETTKAPDGVFVRFSGDAAVHVAEHVTQCVACSQLARKLRRLDKAVRSLPMPPGMVDARLRFESRLQELNLVAAAPMPHLASHAGKKRNPSVRKTSLLWRIADSRLTAAALLMLVIGGGIWGYEARVRQVATAEEAIDKLVEWNLQITQSESPAERHQLYAASPQAVKEPAILAPLDASDRQQADALIENGAFLVNNVDPLAEADHFSHLADLMVSKIESASAKSAEVLARVSQNYLSVVNRGIEKNLNRAEDASINTPTHDQQMAKIEQRYALMQSQMVEVIEKTPPTSKQQFRSALDEQQQRKQQRQTRTPLAPNR